MVGASFDSLGWVGKLDHDPQVAVGDCEHPAQHVPAKEQIAPCCVATLLGTVLRIGRCVGRHLSVVDVAPSFHASLDVGDLKLPKSLDDRGCLLSEEGIKGLLSVGRYRELGTKHDYLAALLAREMSESSAKR